MSPMSSKRKPFKTVSNHRYAVICAPHKGNSGMFSVDTAAKHFFATRELDYDLFVSQRDGSHHFDEYKSIASLDDVKDYNFVIYWGDFLTNPLYGYGDYVRRGLRWGLNDTKSHVKEEWRRIYNPSDLLPGKSLVSVGTNFQQDFSAFGDRHKMLFSRLERAFDRVYTRDPQSLLSLSRQVEHSSLSKLELGTDCAFLQAPLTSSRPPEGTFVYFFWRSRLDNVDDLVREMERRTGLRGEAIDMWLSLKKAKDWKTAFDTMRSKMASAQFVVSDTYHVCVNAMQMRKPVVGVGRAADKQVGTLGDFKKRVLFEMFDLHEHYLEVDETGADEDLAGRLLERIGHVKRLHRSGDDPYYMVDAAVHKFTRSLERQLSV